MPKKETPKAEGPQVNDQFWYELSKDAVKLSVTNLDASAAKLQTLVGWLWGVYTAGASIGVALAKLSYPWYTNLLIGLPSVALIAAYFLAAWSQTSIEYGINPNRVPEIIAAHRVIVKSKHQRFLWALRSSVIAAVLVAVALIMASTTRQPTAPSFQAFVNTQNERDTIALTGNFAADTEIVIKITPYSAADVPGDVKELPYVTSSSGEIQTNIALDTTAPKYQVTVVWQEEEGISRTLQRTIKPVTE